MATRREGLRQRMPKEPKRLKTNAEKCKDYKEKVREDEGAYERMLEVNRMSARQYRLNLTDDQKAKSREAARLRQQNRRAKLKQTAVKKPVCSAAKTPTRAHTREEQMRAEKKKEDARKRQAKRRAKVQANPQLARRAREKRKRKAATKSLCVEPDAPKRTRVRLSLHGLLNKAKRDIKLKRTKVPPSTARLHYQRHYTNSSSVEPFFEKVAVDIPFSKCGKTPKKVLTRRLIDVYASYRSEYPGVKMSFTTFKRRRPSNVLLAGSRKLVQCLCERCVNAMLMVESLNVFLRRKPDVVSDVCKRDKISCVEELVDRSLCANVKRGCFQRECADCGVESLMSEIRDEVSDQMECVVEWKRWEKSERCPKDLVRKEGVLGELVECLSRDLFSLSRHLKVAQWQRRQYQSLKENLLPGHGMLTVDFAENYLCKFQNEVQSAHWAYRQVSVHPSGVFFGVLLAVAIL